MVPEVNRKVRLSVFSCFFAVIFIIKWQVIKNDFHNIAGFMTESFNFELDRCDEGVKIEDKNIAVSVSVVFSVRNSSSSKLAMLLQTAAVHFKCHIKLLILSDRCLARTH